MPNRQKVLLVHRFFAPDVTTYAQMLEQFAQHLGERGHDVTVACAPPSYNAAYSGPDVPRSEVRPTFRIRRFRVPGANTRVGKVAGSIMFPLAVWIHAVSRRQAYDTISVTTAPPIVMGWTALACRVRSRATRVIYHCMDLYPEAAAALGLLTTPSFVKVAAKADSVSVASASRVIVLSEDMKNTLQRRAPQADIAVCNNFILKDAEEAEPFVRERDPDRFRLIFAGNLGRFQGLETLVEGIRRLAANRDDFEVLFLGAGKLSGWLKEQQLAGAPIDIWPHRSLDEAMGIIKDADAAIVSLADGVVRSAYPSKLMMYLELGRPVLCVVEPDSELARTVRDDDLGVVADPSDPDTIASAIQQLIDERNRWTPEHIQAHGRDRFGRRQTLEHWTELYGLSD